MDGVQVPQINKKQSKMNLTLLIYHTLINVLNLNILLLTLISSTAFNTEKFL